MKGRTIIIVHPFDLVCRGLAGVLEELQGIRILCFSSFSEIKIVEHTPAENLLLFVPADCRYADELLELRTHLGEHCLVGLTANKTETPHQKVFDHVFSLDDPASEFVGLAESYFRKEKTSQNDELTNREREVLRLIAMGHTNKIIADKLFISTHTVISHRKNITEKLGIKSIPGLTVYAIIQKIIGPGEISPDQLL